MSTLAIVPTKVNLVIKRGTDNTIEFQLLDSAGAAIDITNDTIMFTARDTYAGAVKIPTKTNGVGAHSTPTSGKTRFKILRTEVDDEATATAATTWLYEVRRISASGDEVVYLEGYLQIDPAVGRQ